MGRYSAGVAAAEEGEVLRLELELVGLPELATKLFQRTVGDFDHSVTGLADEVVVRVIGEVVHRRPVSEVDVVDDAEAFEVVEEPVDG